jgi:hypothetical protein
MTTFDLEKYDKDPLVLIVRNKEIVRHLQGNGIDGLEINKMLNDWHGLKSKVPIFLTKRDKQKQRQIDYAIRYTKALINNEAITDKERKHFLKILERLSMEHLPSAVTLKFHPSETENAKTRKQVIGRQVATINKYIKPFNKMCQQKKIFDLISELLEVWEWGKFTQKQIANFDKNNC